MHTYRLVNFQTSELEEKERRNEAEWMYAHRRPIFSLSVGHRRTKEREKKTTGGNQTRWPGDSFDQKIEFTNP